MSPIVVSDEIADAVAAQQPVVALESTVYSTLGLPAPHNRQVLEASNAAIRSQGAMPALTAIVDGKPTIGVTDFDPIFDCTRKVGPQDIAIAMAQRWPAGVTTVGASLVLAAHAGIRVFATGGIGGVHHNASTTGDVSADLDVLARYPIVTVCSGAKSFLDLSHTLEALETRGVSVLGFGTDELPAFTTASSGLALAHRVDDVQTVAEIARQRVALDQGGVLVCVPAPEPIDAQLLAGATAEAEKRADAGSIIGQARTPFVLAAIAEITEGKSVEANMALVRNNALIAAQIAVAALR